MRRRDHEKNQAAAARGAAEQREIRALIERIFAEADPPEPDTLADWFIRDPRANQAH